MVADTCPKADHFLINRNRYFNYPALPEGHLTADGRQESAAAFRCDRTGSWKNVKNYFFIIRLLINLAKSY